MLYGRENEGKGGEKGEKKEKGIRA